MLVAHHMQHQAFRIDKSAPSAPGNIGQLLARYAFTLADNVGDKQYRRVQVQSLCQRRRPRSYLDRARNQQTLDLTQERARQFAMMNREPVAQTSDGRMIVSEPFRTNCHRCLDGVRFFQQGWQVTIFDQMDGALSIAVDPIAWVMKINARFPPQQSAKRP